jgi:V8-like Glu-specific endopeptidase
MMCHVYRRRRATITLAIAACLLASATDAGAQLPAAHHVPPVPTVGALFFPSLLGLGPALGLPHDCTASVVHSPRHDLAITAAHCVAGTGIGYEFAPGYVDGRLPYGLWTVTAVYVNRAWTTAQDPQHDYAFLRLAPHRVGGRVVHIEDLTGANVLGAAPAPGTLVTVDAYAAGSNDKPLACTVPAYEHDGYPAFDCDGFVGGTSGGPWLALTASGSAAVVGVIGGLHQGGCTASTSYSSGFGADVMRDWQRAASGAAPDLVVPSFGSGCG